MKIMSIRRKLIIFLLFITGILALMGTLLIIGGKIFVGSFKNSLDSMDSLNSIRELHANVIRQRSSLNRYVLLDEPQELLSYEESTNALTTLLDHLGKSGAEIPWLDNVAKNLSEANKISLQTINLCRKGEKQRAIEDASAKLFPKFTKLIALIEEEEKKKTSEATQMYMTAQALSETAGVVVLVVLIFGFLTGGILLRSLYWLPCLKL